MNIELVQPLAPIYTAFWLWQDGLGFLRRVWSYINYSFSFGNISVSLSSLVIGIIVLAATLTITRATARVLDRRMAKRSNLDPGLRYTIARVVKYLLMTGGILIALKQAFGLDLTSIAVVFTALSVGIGFGLQYIAADIASGFILLFERPIRIGDRITIGEDEGDVESINLRTTIVSTNDRIAIIVPNSKLVTQRVVNWSYGDPRARIAINVGVAYHSDVQLVTDTLLRAAEGVEYVLDDPPPKVQFLRFGERSIEFRLLVWTHNPSRHPQIRSDVNYRIDDLFRKMGIEIPHPTKEFLLRNVAPQSQQDAQLLLADNVDTTEELDSESKVSR